MAKHLFFQRWSLLTAATTRLGQANSQEEVFEILRESARAIAMADGVAVVRRCGDEVEYIGEDSIAPLWTGQRFSIHTCISGLSMLARAPIAIPDIRQDDRVPLNAYLSTFVQSMAVFPLGSPVPIAALGLYWKEVRPLPQEVAVLVDYLARAANAAFQLIAFQAERRGEAGSMLTVGVG